jgi:hypothetical protein
MACHGLRAGGAFGTAGAEKQYGLSPMTKPLLYECVHRVNLHPLGAPAESAVGRRVTTPDEVDPKTLLDCWLEQIGVDVEVVLLGAFPHPVQCAFDHVCNGGNLAARVRAHDRHRLFPLLWRDGQDDVENQRRQSVN